jgi:outer membrane receptor protein involved in Fe transport
MKEITQFAAVGPTYMLLNPDVAGEFTSQVAADFTTQVGPTVQAMVNAGVDAAVTASYQALAAALGGFGVTYEQIRDNGIDLTPFGGGAPFGLSTDVLPNQALAVAANAAAPYAAAMAGLNAVVAGTYAGAGTGFNDAASAAYPIFGALEATQAPKGDGMVHTAAGYRRFGDAKRSHWGTDVALEYYFDDKVTFWGNVSYLSQNSWAIGDDDLPFEAYLNTPKVKYRGGIMYGGAGKGLFASVTYQHDDAFESNQGQYGGTVLEKDLIDANIGYKFDNGINLNVSATNLLDDKYRAFPGMPVIGRRTVLTATYSFQ